MNALVRKVPESAPDRRLDRHVSRESTGAFNQHETPTQQGTHTGRHSHSKALTSLFIITATDLGCAGVSEPVRLSKTEDRSESGLCRT